MKDLLDKLSQEVLVLDIVQSLAPDFSLEGFNCQWVDAHCIEVSIDREQHVNSLFAALESQQLHVKSLRNKPNRLEEMFVSLLKSPSKQSEIDYPQHESA